MEKRGIDISRYQGKPDFSKLKNAVDFVILQAGFWNSYADRTLTDENRPQFCFVEIT
jgi:GH25 family lysozyme M1 (1,4-beta-N-acetylmuramidase)